MDNNQDGKSLARLFRNPATRRGAFSGVVRRYSEKLYWQVRRIVLVHEDADDVLQNTFIKAWNGLDGYKGDSRIYTWLSRIAINESLDCLRRQKNLSIVSSDDDNGVANMLEADRWFDGDATQRQLQQAIAQLPDVQRTVFNLRYFENMKYSEMSKVLSTSEGALKASYHIAVKKITEFFQQND